MSATNSDLAVPQFWDGERLLSWHVRKPFVERFRSRCDGIDVMAT